MVDRFLNTETSTHPFSVIHPFHLPQNHSPRAIIAKTTLMRQRYAELDIFRQQVEQSKAGLFHQPYTHNKKSILIYKSLFFAFGLLFATLGITALAITSTALVWGFFGSLAALKSIIVCLCFMLSLLAFTITLATRPEREVVLQCVRKAKAHIRDVYTRKRTRLGINAFNALFGVQKQQAGVLRQMYEEACEKINEKRDDVLHLVHRIKTSHALEKVEKETLLNQAIEDLYETLMAQTHNFRQAVPAN